ncbi:hypothetical protein Tco_0532434 [Tanacetum coccineum]
MAQQIIPTTQLVPKFQGIGRCKTYAVLQSIPCSSECKIVGKILLDHPLSYALTATADVPAVYLQQFWKTVRKVPDTEDTIIFKLDSQEIIYTVDMFCDTLQLPVETPDNPFVAPVNIEVFNRCLTTRTSGHDQTKINILQLFHAVVNRTNVDYAALLWWDFMNNVFQKKDVIQYPRFTKIIIVDLMKKFPDISPKLEEDYHSIKDDIPLVSVYTTGNVQVRGMLILNAFLTETIHATDDYTEYQTVTPTLTTASPQWKKRKQSARETSSPRKSLKVTIRKKKQTTTLLPPPSDDKERDDMAEATLLSLTLYKTTQAAKAQENIAKVQEKLDEEEIEKMVKGEEDENHTKSHKENLEVVDDDDVNDKQKQDESKYDNVEKTDDATEVKDNDDQTNHTLVRTHATGSMEARNKQMQT